jgi:hypothetical protein
MVRNRQDLSTEWQAHDTALVTAAALPPERRNKEAEQTRLDRLAAIDARLAEIDRTLKKDFPEYAALMSPEPPSIVDVASLLRPDEALVFLLDT